MTTMERHHKKSIFWATYFLALFALAVAITLFFSRAAEAQTFAGSASQSASKAAAVGVGGQSGSTINIGSNNTGPGAAGNARTPAIGSTLDYKVDSTSNYEAIDLSDTVPNMWAPGLGGGGSNPCVVSMSGAGVGSGFGISLGRAYNDHECQVRETMRVMAGQLKSDSRDAQLVAKNIACQSPIMKQAMDVAAREGGNSALKCRDPNPPKRTTANASSSTAGTPAVAADTYATRVAACRKVSDREYGACMRRAKRG